MKTNIIAILALGTLALSTATGAPAKMSSAKSSKKTAAAELAAEPEEERVPRKQADARELVDELTTTQKSRLLELLNEGSAEDLAAIKGISTTRATAIDEARPFEAIDEVILVRGIGKTTMAEIVNHARSLTATSQKASSKASSSNKKS